MSGPMASRNVPISVTMWSHHGDVGDLIGGIRPASRHRPSDMSRIAGKEDVGLERSEATVDDLRPRAWISAMVRSGGMPIR